MAVPEQTPYIEYTANGVAASFAVTFQCLSKDTLIVTINGVEQLPALWSLTGGNIVFISAPVNNSIIGIKRSTTLKRDVSYQTYDNSLRPAAIDADIDRLWHALQEQNFKVGQYDYDYSYAVNKSNQAFQAANNAYQRADDAYSLADQIQPLNKGGTGATTVDDARTNLNIYSREEVDSLIATGGDGNVVSIVGGGTGATTADDARTNLDVYSKGEVYSRQEVDDKAIPNATEVLVGKAKIATTAIAQTGTNDTDFLTPKKLRDALNASGAAAITACRAWVLFNGVTNVVIKSVGVLSVTKDSTGLCTIELINDVGSTNYGIFGNCRAGAVYPTMQHGIDMANTGDKTSKKFQVRTVVSGQSNVLVDSSEIFVGVYY